jgi:hypothetical protein
MRMRAGPEKCLESATKRGKVDGASRAPSQLSLAHFRFTVLRSSGPEFSRARCIAHWQASSARYGNLL